MNTVIIPTWSNVQYLPGCLESLFDLTESVDYRAIVIDNGSTDDTVQYLADVRKRHPNLTVIRNETNLGFVKATNQGLNQVQPGENVLLLNDDVQVTDPLWLRRMEDDLGDDIGAVGPVSNFVMGLQQIGLSPQIPKPRHFTNLLIGFCVLIRSDVFQKVGLLDERFGMGGNDDLDLSIRIAEAGYKLMVERRSFILHYGAKSTGRMGEEAYKKMDADTRKELVAKWGQAKVDTLFTLPEIT
mgnify:CR=1 FL=1